MRIAPSILQDTPCPGCGYNLRGLRLDGNCPECGRPAVDTFARPVASIDGHLCSEMLGVCGRLLIGLVVAGALAAAVRRVPGPVYGIEPTWIAGVLLALFWIRPMLRTTAAYQLTKRYGLNDTVREGWPAWLGLTVACVFFATLGVLLAGDVLSSGIVLTGSFGLNALAAGWAGLTTTQLLRRASLRRVVSAGPALLLGFTLLAGAAILCPLPFLGLWDGLAVRAVGVIVAVLAWWVVWLRYQDALRVGLGPVTSM